MEQRKVYDAFKKYGFVKEAKQLKRYIQILDSPKDTESAKYIGAKLSIISYIGRQIGASPFERFSQKKESAKDKQRKNDFMQLFGELEKILGE